MQLGKAKASETVLVHGASGGVGIAAVQLGIIPQPYKCVVVNAESKIYQARALGLRVIGTASTEKGRELVLKEGAHHGIYICYRSFVSSC